ncbi:hypothetical protein [Flavobacterium sp. WC2509]|uniref:hypothetical protein n=1 Tax=Flavobacterium sp. WC2509 TaxID=3461406 RepID=UPI0040448664
MSYRKIIGTKTLVNTNREKDPNIISQNILELLNGERSVMIARYGATELMCMVNYLGVKKKSTNFISYIQGKELDWWWNKSSLKQIEQWSGFFPATVPNVECFCELMIQNSENVDILASWLNDEFYFKKELVNAKRIQGLFLDPFWSEIPWTTALKGKNVLVIHPFEKDIKAQYKRRELLFANSDVLPEFNLITIRAVQSLGGDCEFSSWFDALNYMKAEINKVDFDVCLIGAGAYGFPLASYVKEIGKKAVHVGGSLQLLFGIKGKRWENPLYGEKELGIQGKYPALMNKYWIYPSDDSKPKNANVVEDACYW